MDLSFLGDDPLLNGFVGLLVIAVLVMLFRRPKGPGGWR